MAFASAAQGAADAATAFPWHLAGQSTQEVPTATATAIVAVDRRQSFGSAISRGMLEPPARPVWEMLREYRGPAAQRVDADLEMLAALTYCDASAMLPQHLWESRSQGSLPAAQIQELDERHTQATVLCARLSDSDYAVRVDILRLHARAGDADAQLNFIAVGPLGRSGFDEKSTPVLSDDRWASWANEVLGYEKQALQKSPLHAASSLAWLYDPGPQTPPSPAFSRMADPVEGQAYRVLMATWGTSPQSQKAWAAFAQQEGQRLSPEQRSGAQARAVVIAQELAGQMRAQGKAAPPVPGAPPGPSAQPEAPAAVRGPSPFTAQ